MNWNPSRETVKSSVKTHHSDDITNEKSECKKHCEQNGDMSVGLVPTTSNEAESRLHYVSLLCPTSTEDCSQDRNPGIEPSYRTDVPGRDAETSFSGTARLPVMRSKRPSQPFPTKLTDKPGSANDYPDRDIINCPSHNTASIQTSGMSGLLGASDTTLKTCDSGYHTTGSDATQLPGSSGIRHISSSRKVTENLAPVSFKMASNRIISIPQEALQKAKVLLDEGAGDGRMKKGKGSQISESTEWNHKSHYKGTESSSYGNAAAIRHCTSLRKASSPHNSLQGSSPNPGFVCFKTASNSMIHLSSANLLKAKQLFKDIEDEKLSEDPLGASCTDFSTVAEVEAETRMSKSSDGLIAAPLVTSPSSEQKAYEAYGCLTPSQRADVTELCSLFEEANSQFEFTQFKQAKSTSTGSDEVTRNHPCAKEEDPDYLTGIDFDDSFSSECERPVPRKLLTDSSRPEKLIASSYHNQNGEDSDFKIKPVDNLSCDSSDQNAKCQATLHPEHPSASLVPDNNYDSGGFVSFSCASGKKITVSKEVLKRASKVFDDLDTGCIPLQNSVHDKSSDPSHINTAVSKVQRSRNIPGPHVTFNIPKSNDINQNHYIKKMGLSAGAVTPGEISLEVIVPSRDAQTIQEDWTISELSLPSGQPDPPLINSTCQMPAVKYNLEGAGTNFPQALLPPGAPNRVDTDGRSDERPTSAERETVSVAKHVFKQPGPVCTKGSHQRTVGKKLDISHNNPNSISTKQGACFKTARGTAVNVSERLLKKAREMFGDLEENVQSTHGQENCADEQEKQTAVIENKGLPGKCDDTTNNAKAASDKCENDSVQRTSADHETDKPDAVHLEKQFDVTSVHSRAETPNLGTESNVGRSTPCGNKVYMAEKALAQTTSNEFGDRSGSCQMTVASDEGSGNSLTCNTRGNCGFSTAGGNKVTVSEKSLHYAQSLLNECSEMKTPEPEKASRLSNGYVSSHSLLGGNGRGFRIASGKGVSISPKALEQAKAMFQSCDDRAESGAVIRGCINGETGSNSMYPMPTSSGFVSAGGKGVSISAKALLEVKDMFENGGSIVDNETTYGSREVNTNTKSFELNSNLGNVNCGFSSAGGKRVSVSKEALLRAHALLKECDHKQHLEPESLEFMKGSAAVPRHKNSCGFSTASGKGVSISLKALQEPKARFPDCDDTTSPEIGEVKVETLYNNSTSAHKKDPMKNNCGFSTASGKGVSVSKNALLKAKKLLDECCDVEKGEPGRPLKTQCTISSVPNSLCPDIGMGCSTSVKTICEKEVTLKDCFNDKITVETQVNSLKMKGGSYSNTGKCTSGFSTARGNWVSVSVRSLEEAKAKFRDCDNSDHVFVEEMKEEPVKNESSSTHLNPDKTAPGISGVDEKPGSVSEMSLSSTNIFPVKSDRTEHSVVPSISKHLPQGSMSQGQATDGQSARENRKAPGGSNPYQERSVPGKAAVEVMNCETTRSQAGGSTQRRSSLNLRSLGLGNFTDTQQRYLEQEAMACTRALLEDEDLAEQGLQEAPDKTAVLLNAPPHSSAATEGSRRPGKRLKSEDSEFTGMKLEYFIVSSLHVYSSHSV